MGSSSATRTEKFSAEMAFATSVVSDGGGRPHQQQDYEEASRKAGTFSSHDSERGGMFIGSRRAACLFRRDSHGFANANRGRFQLDEDDSVIRENACRHLPVEQSSAERQDSDFCCLGIVGREGAGQVHSNWL